MTRLEILGAARRGSHERLIVSTGWTIRWPSSLQARGRRRWSSSHSGRLVWRQIEEELTAEILDDVRRPRRTWRRRSSTSAMAGYSAALPLGLLNLWKWATGWRWMAETRILEPPMIKEATVADNTYTPPRVWTWDAENGGRFAKVNRPTAGATHEAVLPVGRHALQLYSQGTPNGVKVTILLEELLERGIAEADYDAHLVNIFEGDQFGSGFVAINPNSKIPALVDHGVEPAVRVFESGSILLYLADKFGAFIPSDPAGRTECLNWLFWQVGAAPFLGGGFGHFYAYAPEKYEYPINRYTMEVKRQMDLLDRRLAEVEYIAGDAYTIADMAVWPWFAAVVRNEAYEAAEFLDAHSYVNLVRWVEQVGARPAVKRGRMVNRTWGDPAEQLRERHDASDFPSAQ